MIKDLRNQFDFYLRNKLTWGIPVPDSAPIHENAGGFQNEVREFLDLFNWTPIRDHFSRIKPKRRLVGADVGARTFSMAVPFDELFMELDLEVELHGIEIDAYRRFSNLRTRKDYGDYYASKIRWGQYHAQDFLKWERPLDFLFMLNPFVTAEPLQAWGLPLKHLQPQRLFDQAFDCLAGQGGVMILSSPTAREFSMAKLLARNAGFETGQDRRWTPSQTSIQKQARIGCFCFSGKKLE